MFTGFSHPFRLVREGKSCHFGAVKPEFLCTSRSDFWEMFIACLSPADSSGEYYVDFDEISANRLKKANTLIRYQVVKTILSTLYIC